MAKTDLQQLLKFEFKILHCVIDYTYMVIDYQQFLNVLIQILKAVIDYTISIVDYQTGFSENISKSHNFSKALFMTTNGLYICDLNTKLLRDFQNNKCLSSQRANSFYPLKNSLANSIAIH